MKKNNDMKKISIWSNKFGCIDKDAMYIGLAMKKAIDYTRSEGEKIEIFIDTYKFGYYSQPIKSQKVFSLDKKYNLIGKLN